MAEKRMEYVPPDPTKIENSDQAIRFWARTLEVKEERLRKALKKAGPLLEDVKREIGSYGPG
ncbi:MAG: DUF3606 domain-containing protein [Betaproteobacteria bacterium]